jgi:choline dehydrogenase-like flavoprotein
MSSERYDAIIVGSGAGGAAAAYKLALAGLRVVVLEKGHHLPADGSTLDIQRVVHQGEFLSHEPWLDGHGRRIVPEEHFNVGGKTKWYGAALLRFAEHEFASDPAHGCRGWPLALSELAPYYEEAERLLGVRFIDNEPDLARILARLQRQSSGWQAQPMPMGLAADIAAHRTEASHFDGFASAADLKGEAERSLLSQLRSRGNFSLLVNAEVATLLGTPGEPTTVTGVRLTDGRSFTAPYVFLAAGALHSPRLLSGYLRSAGLDRTLPAAMHVGRHLKLHLLTAMVSLSLGVKTDLIRKTTLLVNERFPHSSVQPLGFDDELIATLMPRALPLTARRLISRRAYGFFLQTEDGSDPRNRVQDESVSGSLPILDYDERRLLTAVREHRAFTRALQRALVRAGMVSFTRRIGLSGTAHACGSLICGQSAADSVVDSTGRVHGMQGLYVVDGSILPRSSRVNPSLTIYAWGLRAGQLVARQVQERDATAPQAASEAGYAA